MEEPETVAVSLSDDAAIDWIPASRSSPQDQACDTTTVISEEPNDDVEYSGDEEEFPDDDNDDDEEEEIRQQRPTVRLVDVQSLRANHAEHDDDVEEEFTESTGDLYDGGDSCDFCGMETATELCRGDECKQLLNTNFPMYCSSCSQTFHRRYPNHRRFLDAGPSSVLPRAQHDYLKNDDQERRSVVGTYPFSRSSSAQYDGDGGGRRRSVQKSFVRADSGSRTPNFRFGSGIGLAHAQRLVAANAQRRSSSSAPCTPYRKDIITPRWSAGRQADAGSGISKDDSFPYDSLCSKSSVRANQLQPVHDRYQVLLKYMKANPGQSLQEAYKATGMARSTVLGTRCVAELKLVDPKLFAETADKAGPKVKVAQLNRLCQEVLSQPELEVVVAEMRLRSELLPFSSQLSRQLQFCMEANRTGVNPYA